MRQTAFHSLLIIALAAAPAAARLGKRSWTADNPLFYDEFFDPDMIRVGADCYLTGAAMHTMPGLPILHSRDLVNGRIIAHAFERLDRGPDFRLEGVKNIYGQGIWAPSFRHHKGASTWKVVRR
jgi:beta-xylosidase